jgi:MoaA/NifB/PqqE/SkfB family radical SAM enzyme
MLRGLLFIMNLSSTQKFYQNRVNFFHKLNNLKKINLRYFLEDPVTQLPVRINNPFLSREVVFLVTSRCNMCCQYCYNYYPMDMEHHSLSSKLAIKFLDSYIEYQKSIGLNIPLRQIVFSGGEPTLNLNTVFDVLDHIRVKKIRCIPMLLTNGVIASDALRDLIKEKIWFQISFDGGNHPLRRTFGQEDLHERILQTINQINNTSRLPITLHATVTQETVSEMVNVVKFAAEYQIESVVFAPLHNSGKGKMVEDKRPCFKTYIHSLVKAGSLAKSLGIKVSIPEINRYKSLGNFKEYAKLIIIPDGNVTITSSYLSSEIKGSENAIIGNCYSDQGVVVDSVRISEMVNNFLTNVRIHCTNCECFRFCRGRNQNLYKFTEGIQEYKDDYSCKVSVEIYEKVKKGLISE